MSSSKSLRAGIVGFRGYSGNELIQILHRHRFVTGVPLEHRSEGPATSPLNGQTVKDQDLAVVFLATPPEASMELTGEFLAAGAKVVDLSGAFRLRTPENYARWYKEPHTSPALLNEAAYYCPKPVVAGIHGFCVGGGTDLVLCADQIIAAEDVKFGYPPSRVWGVPTPMMWVYRLGVCYE